MNSLQARTVVLVLTAMIAAIALITVATMYAFKASKKDGVNGLAVWASRSAVAAK